MAELVEIAPIKAVLAESRTVAVLGAHVDRQKAAWYVPQYLHEQGYRILPVNPMYAGQVLWGEPVRARLDELATAVDLVDVFRHSDRLAGHVDEILAMRPRPRVVWLQLGIRNDLVARLLGDAGIDVVQDRCTLDDHRRFGLGRIGD